MPNDYFRFKQFIIHQERCAFRVGTDGVLLGAVADAAGKKRILDIGAGTGLISLMLAQRSDATIVALEPDGDSFAQMSENIRRSNWVERIVPVNRRLQDFTGEGDFDLLVSNPPFFTGSIRNPDPRKASARHNDSLSSGELLEGALRLLAGDGIFQVIMPYAEGTVLIAGAARAGLYCNYILKIKPLPSSEVRRMILTFSREKTAARESFLTIEHGERHDFTDEYKKLTKDFYLKF